MAYNPGNWNVYAQGLAGLSSGIDSGASGVAAGLKDWSQKKDLTKSLRGMFSAVDPDNSDMYESMGLPELQGKLQSYSLQHTLGVLKAQKQAMDEETAVGEALRRFTNGAPVPPPAPGLSAMGGIDAGALPPSPGPAAMGGIDGGGLSSLRSIPVPFGAPVILPGDSTGPPSPGLAAMGGIDDGGPPSAPPPLMGGGWDMSTDGASAAAAPDLSASLRAYTPTQTMNDRLRYALATPGLGGAGTMRVLEGLKQYRAMNPDQVNVPPGTRVKSVKVAPEGTTTEYTSGTEVPAAGTVMKPNGVKGLMISDGEKWVFHGDAGADVPPAGTVKKVEGVKGGILISNGKEWAFHTDAASAKATEAQAEAQQYANRMDYNNAIVEKLVQDGFEPSSREHLITDHLPNSIKPASVQAYEAAKSNWITAALRKETKRELSKEGMEKADRQYFPQPGDAPSVVAQKAALRRMAARDVRVAGPEGASESETIVAPGLAPKFPNEAQARAAGAKAGDIILIYDPATASYRRARLK